MHAMDIHGGHTIQLGPRNSLAYAHFSIPISITVEGANILTRNLIIFGQGAIRCHPFILKEVELLGATKPDISAVDNILLAHVGYLVSNLLRCLAYGLSGGKAIFAKISHKKIKPYERQLTRMSAALALTADVSLLILGGSLKRRERISARLGDIMSQLYLASAAIKYFHDNKYPDSHTDSVCWSLEYSLHKIQIAFDELFNNFPNRFLGKCLKVLIFPFGAAYKAPHDNLHKNLVANMLFPSELRARLTAHIHLSKKEDDLGFRLEKALPMMVLIEPLLKKILKEVQAGKIPRRYDFYSRIGYAEQLGTITMEEAKMLNDFEELKNEIIKVNEFSFKLDKIIA
jgi:acyl-CoA dehydrogenase